MCLGRVSTVYYDGTEITMMVYVFRTCLFSNFHDGVCVRDMSIWFTMMVYVFRTCQYGLPWWCMCLGRVSTVYCDGPGPAHWTYWVGSSHCFSQGSKANCWGSQTIFWYVWKYWKYVFLILKYIPMWHPSQKGTLFYF